MEDIALVTIIIPVYNDSFLTEALNSVLNQTYRHLEIIIIDDGSTDGSEKICDEYAKKDSRIFVVHQQNKGLSAARNAGLDIATGEMVVFLDSDDVLLPSFVEEMLTCTVCDNSDLVLCRYTYCHTLLRMALDSKARSYPSIHSGCFERISALRALVDGKINHSVWNKMYRRSLWKGIRFPKGQVYEDIDTTYLVINQCRKISVLDKKLYLHRQHPGSITATNTINNLSDRILALSHFCAFVEANTPNIFDEKQLNQNRQSLFHTMVDCYIFQLQKDATVEQIAFAEKLKQQIIVTGKQIRNCGMRIQIGYNMFVYCRWLLRLIYPAYKQVRRLFRLLSFDTIIVYVVRSIF